MHGKSARTGAPPARAARGSEGHARVLLPCAVLFALVALLMMPTRAYADGANYRTVLYSGEYGGGEQYIVGADNKYDAAAYICGQTSAQVAAYDLTVRYKLSATENDFSALADSLEKDWPGWNEDTLAQSLAETFTRDVNGISLWDVMTQSASVSAGGGIIFNQGGLSLFQVKYWQDSVDCDIYAVDTTSDAVSRARDDLQEILNGGGGGGSAEPDENGDFVMELYGQAYKQKAIVDSGTVLLTLSGTSETFYEDNKSQLPYVYAVVTCSVVDQSRNSFANGSIFMTDRPATVVLSTDNNDSYNRYDGVTASWTPVYRRAYTIDFAEGATVKRLNIYTSNQSWTSNLPESWNSNSSAYDYNEDVASYSVYGGIFTVGNSSGDVEPPSGPGNWPSTPTNPNPDPEPPTVPDPPENPEPDPPSTPVAPTPPPLEPPTNVTIPTGTTPQDYTPWLRAILEQLQTLTDELASHCVHLQEEMQASVNELQDTLIYRFNSLENHIWDLFNGLEDYLHDLAVWLAEQLDYNVNVDPYDDSSVLYWLRQIYGRLGNQPKPPTTILDPDPTEPFDFWAWLLNLINKIVGEIITDLVGDVTGLLDAFKSKFPFSIPWDIAALLTLFDGVRATPQFTVRLPAVEGWYDEIVFDIDLTPYNSVAAVCRAAVNIWWVMCLAMRTDWMLGVMDNASSFGERFVRKVYAVK